MNDYQPKSRTIFDALRYIHVQLSKTITQQVIHKNILL